MAAAIAARTFRVDDGEMLPPIKASRAPSRGSTPKLASSTVRAPFPDEGFDPAPELEMKATIRAPTALPSVPGAQPTAPAPATTTAATKVSATDREKDLNLIYSAPEAQWIVSVLDDTVQKLNLVSYLVPDVLEDPVMKELDPEVVIALRDHFEVEKKYLELLQSPEFSDDPNNSPLFQELDLCLADSTRTVARLLRANPLLAKRLKELGSRRSGGSLEFLNTYTRLRKLAVSKLLMTAEDERAVREQLKALAAKEQEDTKQLLELTKRLASERNEHLSALSLKDQKIERLKSQIAQLTLSVDRDRSDFERRMQASSDAAEAAFRAEEKELLKQLEGLNNQLANSGSDEFRNELAQHRKKYARSQEVAAAVAKYDEEMTQAHDSLEHLKKVYEAESKELKELSAYFDKLNAEKRRQAEEHAAIMQMRDMELLAERRRHDGAMVVQRLFGQFYEKWVAKNKKKKKNAKKGSSKEEGSKPGTASGARPKT